MKPARVALFLSALVALALDLGCASSHVPGDVSSTDGGLAGDVAARANVPVAGFSPREGYVEPVHASCPSARPACLLLGVDGAPRPVCDDVEVRCVEASELAMLARCSCRCEAPRGEPTCACADGESCELRIGGPVDVAGTYCVSNAQLRASRAR